MTLLIMAAGLGTRFKGGIKQLAKVGKNNKTLLEYSIINAEKAGFDKIVLVIRKELESEFNKIFHDKSNITYVYQDILNVPMEYRNIKRENPWGTAHAVLCCKNIIKEPFCVINADDYYGTNSFKSIFDSLKKKQDCMIGYRLINTINSNKSVNRGICKVKDGYLIDIRETKNIIKQNNEIVSNNKKLDKNDFVSISFFGFNESIFKYIEEEFIIYLKNYDGEEFILPNVIDKLVKSNVLKIKIIETNDDWFGITYQEDLEKIQLL